MRKNRAAKYTIRIQDAVYYRGGDDVLLLKKILKMLKTEVILNAFSFSPVTLSISKKVSKQSEQQALPAVKGQKRLCEGAYSVFPLFLLFF